MDRPIIYSDEQMRAYDFLTGFREALRGQGVSLEAVLGSIDVLVTGLTASASSGLTIALAAGRILQVGAVDASAYGAAGADARTCYQVGESDAQTLTFVTSGLSSGQSQYALVQATFTASDAIPSDDPNGGILPYYDVDDVNNSLSGPSGTGTAQPSRRCGKCVVSIKYGAAATTGSEVAPSADSGYAPLYLIDLTYGQTTITAAQIVTHSAAPFLAGILASHHGGGVGQAPKIYLASEVQGILPLSNMPASSAANGGGLSTTYSYAGNPNGHVAGVASVANVSPPDTCWDTADGVLYICTSTGTASTAVWSLCKVPTQSQGDNSTNPASTAYVDNAVGDISGGDYGTWGNNFPSWLCGGRQERVGTFTAQANGATSVTFTKQFSNQCQYVGVEGCDGGTGSTENFPRVIPSTISETGFSVSSARNNALACKYYAVGR
jgi:hypothetical protein